MTPKQYHANLQGGLFLGYDFEILYSREAMWYLVGVTRVVRGIKSRGGEVWSEQNKTHT